MESKNLRGRFVNEIFTDFYQITMVYSLFKQNKHNEHAVYEAFFRKCPFGGEFAIFAGLTEVTNFISNYKFSKEHIEYLRKQLPQADEKFFEYLAGLDTSKLKIYGFREGSFVFPSEPVLRLEGPMAICQLVESTILNVINFPTLIATNARRMKLAAPKQQLIEFGLRRAQGPDGAMMATQYSYLGGFHGTSNVLGGFEFGIDIKGTMAHAYICSYDSLDSVPEIKLKDTDFKKLVLDVREELKLHRTHEGELAAFISYASDFPTNFLALVDTYDTIESGIPNYIIVAFALKKLGIEPRGIRLDSGDLAKLSLKAREIFKWYATKYGIDLSNSIIFASNDINEESLLELAAKGHSIDSFGIGTNLVTCQKQPALGMVYKLAELEGKYKIKFSEDPGKLTLPGKKSLYRLYTHAHKYPILDLITCEDEDVKVDAEISIRALSNRLKKFVIKPTKVEKLLELIWDGAKVSNVDSLGVARDRVNEQVENFNPDVLALKNAKKYEIYISEKFSQRFADAIEKGIIVKEIL